LVATDSRESEYGRYPIFTIELAAGTPARIKTGEFVEDRVAIHAQRDVLRRKLASLCPELGDEIGILYQGGPRGTAKSHRYRVIKYLPGGGYVEGRYEDEDEFSPDEADAATALALEAEQAERDALVSVHAPLAVHEGASDDAG